MSIEDQDAIIGRLVRQRSDAEKTLTLNRSEISTISLELRVLADSLISAELQDHKTRRTSEEITKGINLGKLTDLVTEYRSAVRSLDQTNETLLRLGIK